MRIDNFSNPFFIFFFSFLAVLINIISSIYFFPILLLGVLYIFFYTTLKNRLYYSLFFILISVFLIEINNGFRPFSIILLMLFTYIFISPSIKRILSFNLLNRYIYIAFFYVGLIIIWSLNNDITPILYYLVFINIIIDFIVFGLLIWKD